MSWPPQKEAKVFDLRPLVDNLLAYIALNDADALAWANGGDPLPEFMELMNNAAGRLNTIFPSLIVITRENASDLTSDALESGFQLVLEVTLQGSDPNELTNDATAYARAVESMVANIPSDTLTANTNAATDATLYELETRFDVLRGSTATATSFMQIFQTRAKYRLITSGY